ncbi:hypothetical protein V3391_00925 [Luteimonas sp. SMYT11W]|uniref:PD(D/E)XK endonuclease domain-containing protein n=1 Tax=Luteimonas flava TaxID=3115822 RepID=A0ABU7WA93_9GAMM
MANAISDNMAIGTIGELLVQTRLLQYGVQAAAPLKDSGNDLIALKGYAVRTIQVKTSTARFPARLRLPEKFHLVALVKLHGHGTELELDRSAVYLITKEQVAGLMLNREDDMAQFLISQRLVDALFVQ